MNVDTLARLAQAAKTTSFTFVPRNAYLDRKNGDNPNPLPTWRELKQSNEMIPVKDVCELIELSKFTKDPIRVTSKYKAFMKGVRDRADAEKLQQQRVFSNYPKTPQPMWQPVFPLPMQSDTVYSMCIRKLCYLHPKPQKPML